MVADLLIARTRTVLWIALATGGTFAAAELIGTLPLAAPFVVKCFGIAVTTAALLLLRGPWTVRRALPVSLAVIWAAYLLTALSGIVSPSREYATTAVLFVGGALTTATLLPWGLWPQCLTAAWGAALLCAAVWWKDGQLGVLGADPSLAVAAGLAASAVIAWELHRHRLASIRELGLRRQVESDLRALNADLERRVAARTADLRAANAQLRALSARMESVREDERVRIAREIHDELGQLLTALKLDLDLLPDRLARAAGHAAPLRERLTAMSKMTEGMIDSVRRISSELRPSLLDDLGPAAAIESLVREFQRRAGVPCTFTCEPWTLAVDDARATALFRIAQETLTNVLRHAQAAHVSVSLRKDDGGVTLEVEDDGRGITAAQLRNPRSLGLLGIRERARLVGGEVSIRGVPGRGTSIRVSLPLAAGDAERARGLRRSA